LSFFEGCGVYTFNLLPYIRIWLTCFNGVIAIMEYLWLKAVAIDPQSIKHLPALFPADPDKGMVNACAYYFR